MQAKKVYDELKNYGREKIKSSPAGNRTPVSRVIGGNTHHYTTKDLKVHYIGNISKTNEQCFIKPLKVDAKLFTFSGTAVSMSKEIPFSFSVSVHYQDAQ